MTDLAGAPQVTIRLGRPLVVDTLGRPLTANQAHRMHPIEAGRLRRLWRDHTIVLARQARLGRHDRVTVTAQARYRTRQSPTDTDACAPAVKGCIDGLVVAKVIPDDTPEHVASVLYLAPQVGTGEPDALLLWIGAA